MEEGELEKLFGDFSFRNPCVEYNQDIGALIRDISGYYGKFVLVADTHYCEHDQDRDNIPVIELGRWFGGILGPGGIEEQYILRNPENGKEISLFYSDLISMVFVEDFEESSSED